MTVEQLAERVIKAQKRLARLEAQERPLAFRGWRDDFLGEQIQDEYDITDFAGAGSAAPALVDGAHGGWVRMTTGAGAGRNSRLWLGDAADGFDTLGANTGEGWQMFMRWKADSVTNTGFNFGASNAAFNRFILVAYNSALSANWVLASHDGVFSFTASTTPPVVDTFGWIGLEVNPAGEFNLFVDGALLLTKTTNIPPDILTPVVYSESNGGAIDLDVDFWAVIPKNIT